MPKGGCGAYEDYTEGPFAKDVYIANNTFDRSKCPVDTAAPPEDKVLNTAMLQWSGCTPASGMCSPPDQAALADGGAGAGGGGDGGAGNKVGDALSVPSMLSPAPPSQPYPMPPCEEGGTTEPPVVNHGWTLDSEPGRIQEDGVPVSSTSGNSGTNTIITPIFSNITIRDNLFLSPGYRFLDLELAAGVQVFGNTMVLQGGGGGSGGGGAVVGGDVRIALSTGFSPATIVRDNKCFGGTDRELRPCSVVNATT